MRPAPSASWADVAHASESPGLLRFIVARFFYSDPVNTAIVVMSAFAVHAVGFTEGQALQVLLILTVVAVIATFGWGVLADRWGPRRTLFAVLATWAVGLVIITVFLATVPFLVAGALLGAGLGGVGVVDRLMLLRLTPPDRVGEMFGLYGLVGKFSAVVGPIVYGAIVASLLATPRPRRVPGGDRLPVRAAGGRDLDPARRAGGRAGERGGRGRRAPGGHEPMTIVVAHRGASTQAPENTMEAFRLGVEAGADAIELDVHLTADGQLAVIHDATLDRTTDRDGSVADLTMDEIREADAGAEFPGPDDDFPVPRPRTESADAAPRCSTGCRMTSAWSSRSRPAPPPTRSWRRCATIRCARAAGWPPSASTSTRSIASASSTARSRRATCWCRRSRSSPALVWATEHGHTGVFPWEGDIGIGSAAAHGPGDTRSGARSAATS